MQGMYVRTFRAGLIAAFAFSMAVAGPALAAPRGGTSATSAPAQIPSDTELFTDNFESGNLSNWTVTTGGQGTASVVTQASHTGANSQMARLTVPNYTSNSIAYLRRNLSTPVYALSAVGWFKVLSGGCDDSAGYSAGNVPFFRFFDTAGRRVVGLYRINGSCSKMAKLYVQHSGSFFRTGKNIGFGDWNKLELRATVNSGQSLVQVYLNDTKVYEATASNGIVPFASVTTHNEHPNQVGDLLADDIRVATFDAAPPTNPCTASTPLPSNADPGTTVIADNFEAYNLNKWTATGLAGDGSATIETSAAKTGTCGALLHVTANASSRAYLNKTLGGAAEIWADGWFNVKVEGASGSNVPYWRLFDSAGTRLVDVYRTNVAGALYLRLPNGSGGFVYTSLGRTVALDTWHEIKVHVMASSGTVEIWYDGTKITTQTGKPIGSSYASIQIHAEHFAQKGDLAVDDVIVKKVP
jgi:hypothetical protein